MTKVVIYTDFDGTVTSRVGIKAVFSPFYQSLLIGYEAGKTQDYKRAPMKSVEEIQKLFVEKFGVYNDQFDVTQPDADMLMAPSAVQFFHELLKNDQVSINIVTRNRAEYIKAIFKYQGFSDVEIDKLNIMQSGYKLQDVDRDLKARIRQDQRPSTLYILDDDGVNDYPAMIAAAKVNFYAEDQIKGFNKEPGQFDWDCYLQEVRLDILKPDSPTIDLNIENDDSLNTEPSSFVSVTQPTHVDLPLPGTLSIGSSALNLNSEQPQSDPQHGEIDVPNSVLNGQKSMGHNDEDEGTPLIPVLPVNTETQHSSSLPSNSRPAKIMGTSVGIGFTLGFIVGFALVASGVFAPFGLGLFGAMALGAVLGAHTATITGVFGLIIDIARQPVPTEGSKLNSEPSVNNGSSITTLSILGGKSPVPQSDLPVPHFPGVLEVDNPSKGNTTENQSAHQVDETFNPQ
ncbi:HAD family hydrolase [Legionella quateirensis]|uniref:Dot/Icm T4SS effector n=1 Tax=Legionella quateirensis TaxID=45072 RepID=A0A378KQ10_9GAMM|nr:HAD family hydrolase [Legionella quateirensis]KTD44810.1 Dot/Icm T4SS effector [Legionella quateirensis]STY16269.1 Dot/Icm T4SS effector [Legionella quateirensis]